MRASCASLLALAVLTSTRSARADQDPPSDPDPTRELRFRAGVTLIGISGLSLVAGSILGVRAIVSKNQIGNNCDATFHCNLAGYSEASEATDYSTTSTALIIIGIAAAAAGIPLVVTALPKKPRPSAWVTFTPGGLGFAGSF